MSSFPFDLIHCDIWDPYHLNAYSDHRYFLTLVDDCRRFSWVFLLKHKSNVTTIILKFFNLISTQFDKKIKEFRSNNAKELVFTEFFNDKELFICSHVLKDHNRILLLKGNINT